jgi:hypothetical protein
VSKWKTLDLSAELCEMLLIKFGDLLLVVEGKEGGNMNCSTRRRYYAGGTEGARSEGRERVVADDKNICCQSNCCKSATESR